MLKLSLFLFAITLAFAAASDSSEKNEYDPMACQALLEAAGASDGFGPKVGHAIHSISLRTLKKFEPNVTEKNRVPTVNMNLTSDSNDAILSYAPDRATLDSFLFHTEGMKILDEILIHMDNEGYDIKNFSPLERIVHAFHMEEMWTASLEEYQKIKRNPLPKELCKCAMDIENNGILRQLRIAALGIREPELIYGTKINRSKRQQQQRYGNIYTYRFKRDDSGKQEDSILKDEKKAMPHLINSETWKVWKDMEGKKQYNSKNLAIFLYCALNDY